MLIDSHNHVGYCGKDTDAVLAEMDALGIDVTWLLTWHIPPDEHNANYDSHTDPVYARADGTHATIPLAGLVDACRRHPTRFVAGYCPDPRVGNAPALFEAAVRMHKVRVCGEWSYRLPLDDPRAFELFRAAGRLRCPVVLHMDVAFMPDGKGGLAYQRYWNGDSVLRLERAMQMCPETIFVGHAPGFWRELGPDADTSPEARPGGSVRPGGRLEPMLERYPNLWADLSAGSGLNAMSRDREHARRFILRWQDRLLFGRDQFGDDLRVFLKSLELPAEVLEKVYFRNAVKLVPLTSGVN